VLNKQDIIIIYEDMVKTSSLDEVDDGSLFSLNF